MSLWAVTKKEFLDTRRSYTLAATTALFVLWAGFLAGIQWVPNIYRDSELSTSTLAMMNSMQQSAVYFVPLIGLMLGYAAVVDDRASGSFKLMLALPHSRRDFVFGKLLGRVAVLCGAVAVGYGTAAVIAVVGYDAFSLRIFGLYTLLTLLYGAVYVSVGIGLSVFLRSRTAALAVMVGLYGLFLLFWNVFLLVLQLATVGSELPEGGLPNWIEFVGLLNPANAFGYAARGLIPEFAEITRYPEPDAVFLQNWLGIVVLVVWVIVPVTVGYLRFRRLDLG
ncbi:ABC transporter permease subunit [Halovenus sp. WSH3]|uniref:ABC transporter permease subunit n=1 Tax=Halovenus carboxidivorans TaxID=2692199 RepID=A0A6B0T287_9EURY|nr:ABC transporter permease subunit [Halovenus carboxidivorans]